MSNRSTDLGVKGDSLAFNIGWDAGIYGLEFREDWPIQLRPGWAAARKKYPQPRTPDRYIKKWIQLRVGAYRRKKTFADNLTPGYLKAIDTTHCPVTSVKLTHGEEAETDWSVDRVINTRGYERKNLLVLSTRVNSAKADRNYEEITELAFRSKNCGLLTKLEWQTLYLIISQFYRRDQEDLEDMGNYMRGQFPVADAPLNWMMNLQMLIAAGMGDERGNFGIACLHRAAAQSGLVPEFKKLRARCFKYCRKNGIDTVFMLWNSESTVRQFMNLLLNMNTESIEYLKKTAGEFHSAYSGHMEDEHLEPWARST